MNIIALYRICRIGLLLGLSICSALARPLSAEPEKVQSNLSLNPATSLSPESDKQKQPRRKEELTRKAKALIARGTSLRSQYQYDSAIQYFEQAAKLYKKRPDLKKESTELHLLQADNYIDANQADKALPVLLEALNTQKQEGSNKVKAALYSELSRAYYHNGKPAIAIDYSKRALQITRPDSAGMLKEHAIALYSMGKAHLKITTRDSAQNILQHNPHFDSALVYLNSALAISEKLHDSEMIGKTCNGIGGAYLLKGNYKESLRFLLMALSYLDKTNELPSKVSVLSNLGGVYLQMNRFPEAKTYLLRALALAKQTNDLTSEISASGNLYYTYKESGDFKNSLKYLEKWSLLTGEQFNSIKNKQVEELNSKYKADERARQIELAEAKARQRTSERNALIVVLALMLVTALIIYRFFRQRQRTAELLILQKELLSQQQLKDLKWEQQLATVKANLEGQERERMRIGQDLHDRLGSMLSAIKLYFYLPPDVQEKLTPKQLERHEIANKLLDDSCQEVRRISHDMVSNVLIRFGLVTAVEELSLTINESNQVRMKLSCQNMNHRFDADVEVAMYRTIQELVTNTLKHAKATQINLSMIITREKMLHVIYQDNGVGFDMQKAANGMGVQSLHSRALQLGGSLEFDSTPGNGTVVTLDVPLPETKEKSPETDYTPVPEAIAD